MKVLLDIKDEKAAFILELLKNFKFVKTETLSPQSVDVLLGVSRSVEEMKLIKEGKLEGIPAKRLLDEL
ncbi:MAG: hypothetical protein WBG42_07065 [Cryomorphaceae bacterium]